MELAAPPPGAEVVMRRLAWSDAQPKLEASRPWPLEEVLARVVLLRQSNKPLQRTGPAPAFVYRRFGEPAPQLNVMYVGPTSTRSKRSANFALTDGHQRVTWPAGDGTNMMRRNSNGHLVWGPGHLASLSRASGICVGHVHELG